MESVGPHGQNDPFSRSNNPEAGKPPILSIFVCYSSPSFLVIQNFDIIFAEIFHGHLSYGVSCPSRPKRPTFKIKRSPKQGASWPSWPKQSISKVKRAPEQVNPPFCPFLYAFTILFGDPKF
ncbi:hypothetical protein H5410_024043 [Solanum commersonii]|uniref:Uncharacterized protein n=1 Tax=Solanum commersonii TaxID=4109 RepID=A0A9J5ZKV3_SOLCO|nr:hypothetical protein H5410_024043 [Solanum commersonii]